MVIKSKELSLSVLMGIEMTDGGLEACVVFEPTMTGLLSTSGASCSATDIVCCCCTFGFVIT